MKEVRFTLNGIPQIHDVDDDTVLIDLLRGRVRLTGTKQSCDRKGQCGACTVIVNKKPVRACLTRVKSLDGADVITIEGLGTPENPHLIQEAFSLSGAIQCGFCTPGMIMATKALLDENPDPDVEAVKRALARNLCRCTGYKKIIDAVKLAGRFIRRESTPAEVRSKIGKGMLGVSRERPTAMIKACGQALFNDDVELPAEALELSVVLSTEHHAVIKSIDTSAAAQMPGVVGLMTADDIKGSNRIRQIHPDQPVLCEDKVRTLGDPIVAVAAETREQARAAAEAVNVEYEPLPVMMTPEEALAPEAHQIHNFAPNNIFLSQPLIKGDVDKALAEAHAVVEAEFSTQINHQAPLEPEVSSAYFEGEGDNPRLVIVGRSINIHGHLAQIQEAVGYENLRYQEAFSGGQFGIKASITTEAVTAAAALHFKRPIRYVPTMKESILITNKRHAFKMQVKLAADKDGHLVAHCNDFTINKGAYTLIGLPVLMRSLFMLNGSYYIPNVSAHGRSIYTNNASGAAARGAGPPQMDFALESAMDMLAEKMGIDPLEFRRMNTLKPGQAKATGMIVQEWSFAELCDAIKPHYERAKKEALAFNAQGGNLKRGVGLAGHSFGIGYPADAATLAVELDPDDGITIYAAVADPGEGNDSMLTQIAAHQLGLPQGKVRLYTRDTDKTVGMGPAAGSRMTLMAGSALLAALDQLQSAMKIAGSNTYAGVKESGKPTRYEGSIQNAGKFGLDPKTGQGDAFVSECHNVQMAEVEVDTESGAVRVLGMTVALDAGTIINPQVVEGQLEGGMDQGVGYALREEYIHGKTKDFGTFKFPSIRDFFDSEIIIRETPRSNNSLGATGVGEMTMVSTAPAVTNAIYSACGARIYSLPASPDKVKAALACAGK